MIKKKVICFFKSIDSGFVEYLSWTTAVIVTILTLITIIYTLHNDKITFELNKAFKELKADLLTYTTEYKETFKSKFNDIWLLNSSQGNYQKSLKFFQVILFLLSILWFMAGLSYIFNAANNGELTLVIGSTLLLITVFSLVPIFLKKYNQIDSLIKEIFDLEKLFEFIQLNSPINKELFYKDLFSPTILFKSIGHDIFIDFQQDIRLKDFHLVMQLEEQNQRMYVHLLINSNDIYLRKYKVDRSETESLTGLFNFIENTRQHKTKIFFLSNNHNACFTLTKKRLDDDYIAFYLDQYEISSIPLPIKKLLDEQSNIISLKNIKHPIVKIEG